MVKTLQGKPKSGKPWKTGSKQFKSLDVELKEGLLKRGYEQRKKEKEVMKEARDFEKKLKEDKDLIKRKQREKAEAKNKRKEKNQFKSSSFQVIKDPKKMGKMTKKLRAQISTLPPDMFYKLMHGKNLNS